MKIEAHLGHEKIPSVVDLEPLQQLNNLVTLNHTLVLAYM